MNWINRTLEREPRSATSVYPTLRHIARARLRYGRDELLDTTALVHESYIRFAESAGAQDGQWTKLLNYAPRIMRHVVIDSIRRRNAEIHGGGKHQVELDTGIVGGAPPEPAERLAIRDALKQIQLLDPRLARVVEMRFFEDMTESEVARELGVTERTVRRDWEKAKLLLAQTLRS